MDIREKLLASRCQPLVSLSEIFFHVVYVVLIYYRVGRQLAHGVYKISRGNRLIRPLARVELSVYVLIGNVVV